MQESELNDRELERTVLSVMLSSKTDTAFFADRVHKDDFYFNHHKTIFGGLVDLFRFSDTVDYITLRSKFTGDTRILQIVEDLHNAISSDAVNKEQACRLVKEFSSKRAILRLCHQAIAGLDRNSDSEEVIQLLQHESTDILRSSSFLLKQSGIAESEDWIKEIPVSYTHLTLPTTPYV